MRVLAFAASLRRGSYNRKLIALAAERAEAAGATVDLADFADFYMPLYDGDLETESGLPPGALALKQRLERVDGLLLATPEYNYSIPGTLKNAIDWVSRARPMPWRGKSVYLLSASPSAAGGARGLWHARVPLEACGALVFPDMFSVARASTAFDERGRLRDLALAERLEREVAAFVRLAEAVRPLCGASPPRLARPARELVAAGLEDQTEIQRG